MVLFKFDHHMYTIGTFQTGWCFYQNPVLSLTANVGTEGAVKKFLIWDVSEEFPITQSVLNGLT
jgi:hypothetical protein